VWAEAQVYSSQLADIDMNGRLLSGFPDMPAKKSPAGLNCQPRNHPIQELINKGQYTQIPAYRLKPGMMPMSHQKPAASFLIPAFRCRYPW